jgi:hypothetical protein
MTSGFDTSVRHCGRMRMLRTDTDGPSAEPPDPVRTSVPTTAGTGKIRTRMRPMVTGSLSSAAA